MGSYSGSSSVARSKARSAIHALGRGFDVTLDLKLEYVKNTTNDRLIHIDEERTYELVLPGDLVMENVSKDIKCDQGENTRYRSDVLDFHQMSERFNQNLGITGKMPLGLFTTMYEFKGPWQVDASNTKSLALDGYFVSLYDVRVSRAPLTVSEEVKNSVPSTWQPSELARFIEKYGTHVITGVKIGGKDVVYICQKQSSPLNTADIRQCLEAIAERRFSDESERSNGALKAFKKGARKKVADPFASMDRASSTNNYSSAFISNNNVEVIFRRKGGRDSVKDHSLWLTTVPESPEVISMSFVPITSLLGGIPGTGFLTHAINLYLRYKPPLEELQYFLEFQIPRQWSPTLEPPSSQSSNSKLPALQFCPFGPKLNVSTTQAIAGRRLVTGLKLHLQGKRLNTLSIHLQYLSSLPKILEEQWSANIYGEPIWKNAEDDIRFMEPVQWKSYSQVNTAPIECMDSYIGEKAGAYLVTGAQLQVGSLKTRKVLSLCLQYTKVPGCSIRRSVWDHMSMHTYPKSGSAGFFSQLGLSTSLTSGTQQKPERFVQNSAVFSGGPSGSARSSKFLKFVDVTEMSKGIQDQPGHWVITGGKLDVENGKIFLKVKYSLLKY